ncbi:porin [Burkholderia gladioli]|uniref:porin n=1 Tax=Burkholderia gladioli TaxID=28095 RepID=UPI001640E9EB|nr:porin [Burkholderia gladioli]
MKQTTFAVAACAALSTCGAHAQSSVSLYGVIDAGLVYTSNAAGSKQFQAASGTVTGSHWGIAGREDLGGGTAAIFALENGFSVMNGSLRQGGRLFGYQSWAGLANRDAGTLTVGRQYDSVVDYLAPLSFTGHHPGGNNLSAHPYDNDNLNNSFRVNNAIKYASPDFHGLTFGTLYAFSNEAGGFDDNRLYSAGASYHQGPLTVAAGYLQANNGGSANTNGAITLTERSFVAARQRTYGAGLNYRVGPALLGMVWTRTQLGGLNTTNGANGLNLAQNGQGASFSNYELNAGYLLTPYLNLNGEYTYTQGSISNATSGHRPHWHEVSLQADYLLSKTTDLYAQVSYQRISADGSGLGADVSGQTPSSTSQQTVAGIGMRHKF